MKVRKRYTKTQRHKDTKTQRHKDTKTQKGGFRRKFFTLVPEAFTHVSYKVLEGYKNVDEKNINRVYSLLDLYATSKQVEKRQELTTQTIDNVEKNTNNPQIQILSKIMTDPTIVDKGEKNFNNTYVSPELTEENSDQENSDQENVQKQTTSDQSQSMYRTYSDLITDINTSINTRINRDRFNKSILICNRENYEVFKVPYFTCDLKPELIDCRDKIITRKGHTLVDNNPYTLGYDIDCKGAKYKGRTVTAFLVLYRKSYGSRYITNLLSFKGAVDLFLPGIQTATFPVVSLLVAASLTGMLTPNVVAIAAVIGPIWALIGALIGPMIKELYKHEIIMYHNGIYYGKKTVDLYVPYDLFTPNNTQYTPTESSSQPNPLITNRVESTRNRSGLFSRFRHPFKSTLPHETSVEPTPPDISSVFPPVKILTRAEQLDKIANMGANPPVPPTTRLDRLRNEFGITPQGGKIPKKSLSKCTVAELKERAKKRKINVSGLKKDEIIAKLRGKKQV